MLSVAGGGVETSLRVTLVDDGASPERFLGGACPEPAEGLGMTSRGYEVPASAGTTGRGMRMV